MAFVQNFVAGAFASKKIATQWLNQIQPQHPKKLKVVCVVVGGSRIYYVVY